MLTTILKTKHEISGKEPVFHTYVKNAFKFTLLGLTKQVLIVSVA
jgi:hypothetical protein